MVISVTLVGVSTHKAAIALACFGGVLLLQLCMLHAAAAPVAAPSADVIQHLPNDPAYVEPKRFDWKRVFKFKKEAPPPDSETIINVGPRDIPSQPGTIVRVNQDFCLPERWLPGVYRATVVAGALQLQGPRQQGVLPLQLIPKLNAPSDDGTQSSPFSQPTALSPTVVVWDANQQWFDVTAQGRRFHTNALGCY